MIWVSIIPAQPLASVPWYFDSSFSSFRSFVRTSVGNSLGLGDASGAFSFSATFSATFSFVSADSVFALTSVILSAFSPGAGVPTLEGSSDSSSITKAFSNSEGSGPLAGASPLSFGFGRLGFEAGDSPVLEEDLAVVEEDLEIGAIAF
jgi:hypothetical protein